MGPAHFLGKIGVFDSREAVAPVGAGQPEVPQAALAGFRLEALQDLGLAIGEGKAVAGLADLRMVLRFDRHHDITHHGADLFNERLDALRHTQIHVSPLYLVPFDLFQALNFVCKR